MAASLFNLPNVTLKSAQGFVYNSNVIVTGSVVSSSAVIGSNVNALGTLNVSGAAVLGSSLAVTGNITTLGTLSASNLTVLGDFTTLNTLTSNTEQMVVNNAGTGPALIVRQTGTQPVAEFIDAESGSALFIGNNGNVGIGTTTPIAPFHTFANSAGPGMIVNQQGTGTIADFRDAGVQKIIFDANGNIGIGTTIVTEAIRVEGNVALSGGNRFIGTTSLHNLALRTNNTDRITVSSNGNVGIVNSLTGNLTIVGEGLNYNSYLDLKAIARSTFLGLENGWWRIESKGSVYENGLFSIQKISASNDSVLLRPFNIDANGNVGIGTGTVTEALHVEGNVALGGGSRYIGTRTNNTLSLRTNGLDRVTILSGGNVGIGTTPLSTLHIVPPVGYQQQTQVRIDCDRAYTSSDPFSSSILFATRNGTIGSHDQCAIRAHYPFTSTSGLFSGMSFHVGGNSSTFNDSSKMLELLYDENPRSIFRNGNVGIGTTNPQSTLHVQGNGLFTGYVKQNGIPAFSARRNAGTLTGPQTIIWNNVFLNNTNSYNSTTGIFTAPITGLYFFAFFGLTDGSGSTFLDIRVNGSYKGCDPFTNAVSSNQAISGSVVLSLNVNDQVSVALVGLSSYTFYGINHNHFCGHLVG